MALLHRTSARALRQSLRKWQPFEELKRFSRNIRCYSAAHSRASVIVHMDSEDKRMHNELGTELFEAFAHENKHGNLELTANDLLKMMASLGANRSKEVIWDLMMFLDKSRTGRIHLEEFLMGYDFVLNQTFTPSDVDDIFHMLDRDGSGDIDVEELSGLLLTTGGHISREDAREIVAAIDYDQNGTFDKEELTRFLREHPGWIWKLKACYKSCFVIGPPGSGKGVLCAQLVREGAQYIKHVSSGDLLRSEIDNETPLGLAIADDIINGRLVPSTTVVQLLRKFLTQEAANRFTLIDGFPRNPENLADFIKICGLPTCALVLECPDEVVVDRILKRGLWSDRADDTAEVAAVRLQSYHNVTRPIVAELEKQGVEMIYVDSTLPIEENCKYLLSLDVMVSRGTELIED